MALAMEHSNASAPWDVTGVARVNREQRDLFSEGHQRVTFTHLAAVAER